MSSDNLGNLNKQQSYPAQAQQRQGREPDEYSLAPERSYINSEMNSYMTTPMKSSTNLTVLSHSMVKHDDDMDDNNDSEDEYYQEESKSGGKYANTTILRKKIVFDIITYNAYIHIYIICIVMKWQYNNKQPRFWMSDANCTQCSECGATFHTFKRKQFWMETCNEKKKQIFFVLFLQKKKKKNIKLHCM
ncbi:hypothetical protein RFI_11380 [Reticulomyxa filosa]|uniref:Uncharacterized protein n=1 Tax=Reticulomyxa filosa TaxID=46433 RepID=X6NJ40_RETFI|nr:hypothetical protein RFI_11380 [Reticulomyxa filosa]|eukprot:ETO25759.1 hypothetical protein RFI_11380 [Reticulomyxa filosa]